MRMLAVVVMLVGLVGVLTAGCEQAGFRPAYAVFRFVDANGRPVQMVAQPLARASNVGVVVRENRTTLPDGRAVIQQLVVVDPLEIAPTEYRVESLPDGLVSVSGGSLDGYVVTPPSL